MVVVGIDATNIRHGGGRTHLIELLREARPHVNGIDRIVVWSGQETLNLIQDRDWLEKRNLPALNSGLMRRSFWQRYRLSKAAQHEKCDVLFVPGGSYAGNFFPVVTMSQNMLPFEWSELSRYGLSLTTFKLVLLRWIQSISFRRSEGVVFLTKYARDSVQQVTGKLRGSVAVIPHGLSRRFSHSPRVQHDISSYNADHPLRLLYVSIVDQYKHQWIVVEAVGRLRSRTGWHLTLDLVGPNSSPALVRLQKSLNRWDPDGHWVRYHGPVPYGQLHTFYQQADAGIFASSCENMPNILLEMMASGLPIACSDRGPMPEILSSSGIYFDPLSPSSTELALEQLIASSPLRTRLAHAASMSAREFSWDNCSEMTFQFLASFAKKSNEHNN